MADDVQLPEPPEELLQVARAVSAEWMHRVVVGAVAEGGHDATDHGDAIERLVAAESEQLLGKLAALLATDVDDQRATPLQLYRDAVGGATRWLRSVGVEPPAPESAPLSAVAADPYRLGPATWSDIDPAMHDAGLRWGAWKAMAVLRRRRDEGRR